MKDQNTIPDGESKKDKWNRGHRHMGEASEGMPSETTNRVIDMICQHMRVF